MRECYLVRLSHICYIYLSMHLLFYVIAIDANAPSVTQAMPDVAPVCRHYDQHL